MNDPLLFVGVLLINLSSYLDGMIPTNWRFFLTAFDLIGEKEKNWRLIL